MKKFSIIMVSLVAMAGLAFAQAKAPAGAGSAAPAAKAPAGAGSAAGSAAKAPAGGAAGSAAGPAMEAPKPPAEIKTALTTMGTHQTCTGTTWGGPDGKMEMKMKGTGTNALALDGFAIKQTANMQMGEAKQKMTLKIESFMIYDSKAAMWRSAGVANDGAMMVGTATMKDGKWESMSDMYGGMMGNGKFREHGDMSDPKAGMKMTGESSTDGGKTWNKVYEMVCKKA